MAHTIFVLPLCLLAVLVAPRLQAETVVEAIAYSVDGLASEGVLVYAADGPPQRSAVLMVPNWMGVSPAAIAKATRVAGHDRVVFIADVYGVDVRPSNADEARAAATALRSDRPLLRRRSAAAYETMMALATDHPIDPARSAAIGFCFGGGAVLELARSGHPVPLVVSFHGNLDSPLPASTDSLRSRIIVLHGADDPLVPDEQVGAFQAEMRSASADWQLVSFGGAVHSFTDPLADQPGVAVYHPQVAQRAFAILDGALVELREELP